MEATLTVQTAKALIRKYWDEALRKPEDPKGPSLKGLKLHEAVLEALELLRGTLVVRVQSVEPVEEVWSLLFTADGEPIGVLGLATWRGTPLDVWVWFRGDAGVTLEWRATHPTLP